MSESVRFEDLLEALRARRPRDDLPRPSDRVLLREHLRREAAWAAQLGVPCEPSGMTWLVRRDAMRTPERIRALAQLTDVRLRVQERRASEAATVWLTYRRRSELLERFAPLPEPYLPLVRFFHRNGQFRVEHGDFFDFGHWSCAFRPSALATVGPLLTDEELEHVALDVLDRQD